MTKRHDSVFDDVLGGLDDPPVEAKPARYLRRASSLAEQARGERQEALLRLVDPADCRLWARHNRAYDLLTEANTRDLIDGLIAQGRQEFPAIVRRLPDGDSHRWEVICGARRHFAVSWLRANTYPQFRYLIEERDLTDEEAFRLADIENRDREDISDFERARDYADAVTRYYGGLQKRMAERLEVSPAWLSRYLRLAALPEPVVAAFASIRDLRELHARKLRPLLEDPKTRDGVLSEAEAIRAERAAGAEIPAAAVVSRLMASGTPRRRRVRETGQGVFVRRHGDRVRMEFPVALSDADLRAAVEAFIASRTQ